MECEYATQFVDIYEMLKTPCQNSLIILETDTITIPIPYQISTYYAEAELSWAELQFDGTHPAMERGQTLVKSEENKHKMLRPPRDPHRNLKRVYARVSSGGPVF